MIDLDGLPLPDGAPAPGACVRLERPEPGLLVLVLDPPHRESYAVFDVPLLKDLEKALDEARIDDAARHAIRHCNAERFLGHLAALAPYQEAAE